MGLINCLTWNNLGVIDKKVKKKSYVRIEKYFKRKIILVERKIDKWKTLTVGLSTQVLNTYYVCATFIIYICINNRSYENIEIFL